MTVESLNIITDAELLETVKSMMDGITGNYHDRKLQLYIDDVKGYLARAGVRADVMNSSLAVGCITRGVTDSWYSVAGAAKYSTMFYERADALRDVKVKGAE